MKNTHTSYSLSLYLIILSICVWALERISQINAKIREMCVRKTCKVYANDSVARYLFTILAENQIFVTERSWTVKLSSKDCSAVSNIIKVKLDDVSTLQEKLHPTKPAKFCQQNHTNTRFFGEQPILLFHC